MLEGVRSNVMFCIHFTFSIWKDQGHSPGVYPLTSLPHAVRTVQGKTPFCTSLSTKLSAFWIDDVGTGFWTSAQVDLLVNLFSIPYLSMDHFHVTTDLFLSGQTSTICNWPCDLDLQPSHVKMGPIFWKVPKTPAYLWHSAFLAHNLFKRFLHYI